MLHRDLICRRGPYQQHQTIFSIGWLYPHPRVIAYQHDPNYCPNHVAYCHPYFRHHAMNLKNRRRCFLGLYFPMCFLRFLRVFSLSFFVWKHAHFLIFWFSCSSTPFLRRRPHKSMCRPWQILQMIFYRLDLCHDFESIEKLFQRNDLVLNVERRLWLLPGLSHRPRFYQSCQRHFLIYWSF